MHGANAIARRDFYPAILAVSVAADGRPGQSRNRRRGGCGHHRRGRGIFRVPRGDIGLIFGIGFIEIDEGLVELRKLGRSLRNDLGRRGR